MAGIGQRFLDANYKNPKPLVEAGGKTILEHIIGFFPGENNFIFICNEEHAEKYNINSIVNELCPTGKVVIIPKNKLGPVYTTLQASKYIDDEDEVILQYCDVRGFWDYDNFLNSIRNKNVDGSVIAHRGFHPHMLGNTQYAFMKDDGMGNMLEIQEKKPYTSNRMNEYASIGTHYFKTGKMMKHYFNKLIDKKRDLNGEYYVSLVYNLLVEEGLNVSIYEVQHVLHWGTPYDLEVYNKWDKYFRFVLEDNQNSFDDVNILVPMAGAGSRFAGYDLPKPLVEISGNPMYSQSINHVGSSNNITFVCQKEHAKNFGIDEDIEKNFPGSNVVFVDGITEGQACTCEIGINSIKDHTKKLFVMSCDNGVIFDHNLLSKYMDEFDCLVFGFKNDPSSRNNPNMYSWADIDEENNIKRISMKTPISDNPFNDYALVGSFYFRDSKIFLSALNELYRNVGTTNNEYYVDNLVNEIIKNGNIVKLFPVEQFICWGTPDDLNAYKYWQSFFHKYNMHPYDIRNDVFATNDIKKLDDFISKFFESNNK